MVPSDRIAQNVGSKKSISDYLRKKYYQNTTTMLAISIPSDDYCLHKKVRENINGTAVFVIVVVER